ncbi:PA domain-containing protein [Monaibacterium marinum]|uniref:Carboxypeptidase Q n=1 Tax=Pontivivens marinum TaxID=1690039 RepID=A0A2C9CSI5_9RHOB|nr:M28 family peptidase [Monaibacterium marinum]SOH94316.1 PA domain-containing protein [Monaibacterium marinum]
MLDSRIKTAIDQVSDAAPWALVEHFSTFPRWKPEDVAEAASDIARRLDEVGVPCELLNANLYLSIPYDASVEANGVTYTAKPLAYAKSIPEGLTGTLVHVPGTLAASTASFYDKNRKNESDADAERLRGKIVLTDGFANPQKVLEFQQKGAIGVIAVNPGVDRHWGICSSIWGTPDLDGLPRKPMIPVAAVSNPDGAALVELAQSGGTVTLKTRLEEGWFSSPVPVVNITGSEEAEKFVLLHGHYDSWDVGVGDNATGDAAMLEIARVLWANKDNLRRSVRIAWWPGHSTGRYAGSAWFADAFAIDLDENCVAQVNCDSPGCRWADTYENVAWMSETEAFCKDVIRDATGLESSGERPLRAGDYSFNNIGLTSFFMLSSTMSEEKRKEMEYYTVGGCGGNIAWHTENDVMEIADKNVLMRDIKLYLAAVMSVANAPILPFDWRNTAAEFEATLGKYTQQAGADAALLEPVSTALSAFSTALDTFYTNAPTMPQATANDAIQSLARILVPLNYTRGPRFGHDPALPVPALPLLAVATQIGELPENQQGFARTQLVRGVNRTVAALRAATRLVSQ